jgi:hypothetical protein
LRNTSRKNLAVAVFKYSVEIGSGFFRKSGILAEWVGGDWNTMADAELKAIEQEHTFMGGMNVF